MTWFRLRRLVAAGAAVLLGAALAVSVGASAAAAPPPAAVVYLDPVNGLDNDPCLITSPCATLDRALRRVATGGTVRLAPGQYLGTTAVPAGLTITIQGVTWATTSLNGMFAGTVLTVPSTSAVTLVDLTVMWGDTTGDGGGIRSAGGLTLIRSRVYANHARDGGGIHHDGGLLRIADSRIDTNQATGSGGGIRLRGGSLSMTGSTVDDNRLNGSGDGAGIASFRGEVEVSDSTLYRNFGARHGGGIYALTGALALRRVTVSDNVSRYVGGGVFAITDLTGDLAISGSIMAGNLSNNCALLDTSNTPDGQYNVDSDGSCLTLMTGFGVMADPGLDGLRDNGGPTPTRAISVQSAAHRAIPADYALCDGADQRGQPRRDGTTDGCDIGAFQAAPALRFAPAPVAFGPVPVTGPATADLKITNVSAAPVSLTDLEPTGNYKIDAVACPALLGPGEACTVEVTLTPAAGANPGTITIRYDGGPTFDTSGTVALTGTGVDPPRNVTLPAIIGKPQVGVPLKAHAGSWLGGTPMSFAYVWQLCTDDDHICDTVAKGPHYTPGASDLGWLIQLTVVAVNSDGEREAISDRSKVQGPA
jgi:hypothetical protein